MSDAEFERLKTDTLLRFRANHRADRRPAETLESDTDLLAQRFDDEWLNRFVRYGRAQ